MIELKSGNYTLKLEQRVHQLIGCCPFHEENTPSFFIEPARDRFRCLSCGRKGGWLELLLHLERKGSVITKATLTTASPKIPPHSIEAEQAVLGSLLLDNEAWNQVVDRISEADFYLHEHRILFRRITDLMLQSIPLDIVTISEALEHSKELDIVGGVAYVADLAQNTPNAANVAAYAGIVRERSILRQLIDTDEKISKQAKGSKDRFPELKRASEYLEQVKQEIRATIPLT